MKATTRHKLSPQTADMLERAASGEPVKPGLCRVLVQLHQPIDADVKARLTAAGLTIQGTMGDVITARVEPAKIETVAESDDVKYLEISQPLFTE